MQMSAIISTTPGSAKLIDDPRRFSDQILVFFDRWRWPALAILGAILLAGFNGQWQIEPDSALYLILGRNLALGRGYVYHGQPHDLAYPGLPYTIDAVFLLFRNHALLAANGMILLCGLAALAMTYRLVLLAFDRPTAVVVTLGVGLSHEFFRYCFEIMTDVPALLGVMTFLAGHQAIFGRKTDSQQRSGKWWDWVLLIVGLIIAASTRPTSVGLLIAWIMTVIWTAIRDSRHRRASLAALGIVAALILLLIWLDPRRAAGSSSLQSYEDVAIYQLTHNLGDRLQTVVVANLKDLFGLTAGRAVVGMPLGTWWLNAILGTTVLAAGIALVRKQLLWGLWIAINIATMIFFVSHDRYIVQILPLLVLGWWLTIQGIAHRLPRTIGNWVFTFLFLVGIGPNLGQCIGVIIHQHQEPFLSYYKEGRFPPYLLMAKEIAIRSTPGETVICPDKYARIMTYFSHRDVFEPGENPNLDSGRILVVLDPDDDDFALWLKAERLITINPPLASVDRPGGAKPMLLLRVLRARLASNTP
jgi:hypothetical protein